ncbi:MAG TPA: TIGR01906 family membrane protein [Anaerolineae bacterium]|nr:TIGR01906 family membrane protein [Anaerolineae bacterium]
MLKKLLSLLITLAVPFLLVVSCIRLVANDWLIYFEYNTRPGFPADPYGFTLEQRTRLAMDGLYSVLPQGEGMIRLEQAKLPDGSPAFNEREIKHMQDVRVLMAQVYPIQLMGLALIVILGIVLHRFAAWRRAVPDGLKWGAILTLTLLATLIAYVLINFDAFFLTFHQLFFAGDTFMFLYTDTLIRLYPEVLWSDASILIGVMTVVMAVVLLVIGRAWLTSVKSEK